MESNEVIAPFVMKTYQMVNDPKLDGFIRWGKANNSFIVVDSLDFSQRLLPAYFKHNNFSSFVRQLNTYGFRKVDPDRWEFANEWFLRGQTHLLKNIGRKRQNNCRGKYLRGSEEEEEEMVMEIARLKQAQKDLEQEVIGMNKRLEATERRPEQMMALLCKVAEDPEILSRMMFEKVQRSKRLVDKKRQRLYVTPLCSSSMGISETIKHEDDQEYWMLGGSAISSLEGCYELSPSSTGFPGTNTSRGGGDGVFFAVEPERINRNSMYESSIGHGGGRGGVSGVDMDYFGGGATDPEVSQPPPYPFSLLGGGF